MRKVLVTGASGFIGGYVIKELLNKNVQIVATSRDIIKAEEKWWFSKVTFKEFDIQKYDGSFDCYKYFGLPSIMIHLAWEGLPNYKDSFHIEKNLPAHKKFLENIISNGLRDLTVTGTCLEYGMQEGSLSEEMKPDPLVPYAIAKDSLRKYLEDLKQRHYFFLKWVRLFYMFGEGQSPSSILSQLQNALDRGESSFNMSGGEQERDYLPVEQVAKIIVKIALQKDVMGVINCSSARPVSIKQLVTDYLRLGGKTIALNTGYYPYPDYEPMRFWGNNEKFKSIKNSI